MLPYFILILVPLVYSLVAQCGKVNIVSKSETKICQTTISLFFFIFFILLALRSKTCGVDLANYEYYFKRSAAASFKVLFRYSDIEPLYQLLNKVISLISSNYNVFLAIVAFICVVPLWILYKNSCDMPYLAILLFMTVAPYNMYFSGLRQAIAMSIVALGYPFCRDRKLIKFCIVIAIAFLFHQSALIAFAMYPIYGAKITRKWLWFVVSAVAFLLIFNEQIFHLALNLLPSKYIEKYGTSTSTGAFGILILLFLFSVFCILITDEGEMNTESKGLRNILLMSTCLQSFAPIHNIAMRFNYYFLIFVPLAVSRILPKARPRYKKVAFIAYIVMCVFFLTRYIIHVFNEGGADVLQIYPYVPFWKQRI